jgi:hypothetical protein
VSSVHVSLSRRCVCMVKLPPAIFLRGTVDSDIAEVISSLFAAAKAGDVAAAKNFLSYTVGNPTQSFQLEADISAMQKVDYDNLFESLPKENLIQLLRETHKSKLIHENNP